MSDFRVNPFEVKKFKYASFKRTVHNTPPPPNISESTDNTSNHVVIKSNANTTVAPTNLEITITLTN